MYTCNCKPRGLKTGVMLHSSQVGEEIFNDKNKTSELRETVAAWGTSDVIPWSLQKLNENILNRKRKIIQSQNHLLGYVLYGEIAISRSLNESTDSSQCKKKSDIKRLVFDVYINEHGSNQGVDISMNPFQQRVWVIINPEPFFSEDCLRLNPTPPPTSLPILPLKPPIFQGRMHHVHLQ